jgi:signal peptidase I
VKKLLGWLLAAIGVALAAMIVLRLFVFDLAQIDGTDMLPNLGRGAWVVVRRGAEPARGDMVMAHVAGRPLVRRVVGLPGDRLAFDGHIPVLGGVAATYRELSKTTVDGRAVTIREETLAGATFAILDDDTRRLPPVPEQTLDGYYLASDHREQGTDSRNFGVVARDAIRGVVVHQWSEGDRQRWGEGEKP